MKKIGILTLPFQPNYGFLLQAFALHKVLASKGTDVILLDRAWNRKSIPTLSYKLKRAIFYKYLCKNVYRFYKSLNITRTLRSSTELWEQANNLDGIVVGSDQVWSVANTRGADLNYFLDFIHSNSSIRRYTYAASFGKDKIVISPEEKETITKLLPKFDTLSVREESGLNILSQEFGVNGVCDLDPTLLIDKSEYLELIKNEPAIFSDALTTYILDNSIEKKKAIEKFAKDNNLRVHNLYNRKYLPYYSVEHWLAAIAEAKFVIVDSFHGMVFSIIFEKPFFAILNKRRGATRFISLLNKLGLSDRLVYDINKMPSNPSPINYEDVKLKLMKERALSMETINRITRYE